MQQLTNSTADALLSEIVSDASGIPAPLIRSSHQLAADLGLSPDQIDDLRYAAEFEFCIEICPDGWMQHCDCIESIQAFLNSDSRSRGTQIGSTSLKLAA